MAPTLDVVSHVQLFPWSGIKHPSAPSDQLNPLKCLRVADCARIGTVITGLMRNSENEANVNELAHALLHMRKETALHAL